MIRKIFILILLLNLGCQPKPTSQIKQASIRKEAIELNNIALALAQKDEKDSVLKAIELFDSAIKIQPDYFYAHWNKMAYQNQLGLYSDGYMTLQELEKIAPQNAFFKTMDGAYLDRNGDSLGAVDKYNEAEKLFVGYLDTLTYDPQSTNETNRAINLKLLGKDEKANEILKKIEKELTEPSLKEHVQTLILSTRRDLLYSDFRENK